VVTRPPHLRIQNSLGMSESRFFGIADESSMESLVPRPGTSSRAARFGEVEFRVNSFERDALVPPHEHDWQSLIFVLNGEVAVSLDGDERHLRAGGGAYVQAGTRHGLRAIGSDARVVDLWWPIAQ
jgi:quercetin dioxygenase-like cupin family protein